MINEYVPSGDNKRSNRISYLRLYAPLGSELINASGDIYKEEYPYFDYDKPEFQKDADAQKISDSLKIDTENATEIYTESGKRFLARGLN